MMEAPAPSVTLGGSAAIGIKNVDDDKMPNAESITLVRAYKVTFASSGTTDGGLMFGAGMSIRDDTGEENEPVVKGSHVYVGGGDGSWKLQFGGNDPGALLAGGIGFADDRIDRGGADISLSGSMQGVEYRLTMADPQDDSNDWSVGAKFSAGQIGVGVGMDSEDGLAIGVTTDVSGLSTTIYYSSSESPVTITGEGYMAGSAAIPARVTMGDGMGIHNERMDGDDADELIDAGGTITYTYEVPTEQGDAGFGTSDTKKQMIVVTRAADTETDGEITIGAITAITIPGETGLTGSQFTAEVDGTYLILTDNAGTADDEDDDVVRRYLLLNDGGTAAVPARESTYALDAASGKWTGLGAKVAIPAGEGATVSVGYSRKKQDVSSDGMGSGSATSSRIELDFSYDLGGGATFNAGIDKDDNESLMIKSDASGSSFMTTSSDKTTLEAKFSFSF